MDFDPNSIVVGGVSAFVLLLFLVQTVREMLTLEGKYIPAIAAVLGVGLMIAVAFLPEAVLVAMAQGLALAAAVSLSVRYVKEAPHGKDTQTLQRDHVPIAGSRTQGEDAPAVGEQGGHAGIWNSGETQPLPDYQEDDWSRYRG